MHPSRSRVPYTAKLAEPVTVPKLYHLGAARSTRVYPLFKQLSEHRGWSQSSRRHSSEFVEFFCKVCTYTCTSWITATLYQAETPAVLREFTLSNPEHPRSLVITSQIRKGKAFNFSVSYYRLLLTKARFFKIFLNVALRLCSVKANKSHKTVIIKEQAPILGRDVCSCQDSPLRKRRHWALFSYRQKFLSTLGQNYTQ